MLTAILSGALFYRLGVTPGEAGGQAGNRPAAVGKTESAGEQRHCEPKEAHAGHEEAPRVTMTAVMQRQNGVQVALATKSRLAGTLGATGKVEANADRIAHVSPRIPGQIVAVRASLGDVVAAGQALATLDSVELGEALNRYHQSRTKLALARSDMERVRLLVDKKIAARKEILLAETTYQTAQTELRTDGERLALYGIPLAGLKGEGHKKPLLPVRSPISGTITEKHAIVGELSDPSKSLYTVADLSLVWVVVDINEKDLARVQRGQLATVTVGAFPDLKPRGRITYLADQLNETTRTVKARIEVANPGRKLKPEMFATVELTLPSDAPPLLAVPEDVLVELDGGKVVFVAETADSFVPRRVLTGRASGGLIEITSGLKEGERYAVKGAFILKSELKKGELEGEAH